MHHTKSAADSRSEAWGGSGPLSAATTPAHGDVPSPKKDDAAPAASPVNISSSFVCSKSAAAFVAVLQSSGQRSCGVEAYPSHALTSTRGANGVVPTSTLNEIIFSRRRSRGVSVRSPLHLPGTNNMFLFSKDNTEVVETPLPMPELPSSPKERRKSFAKMLFGFVKARDADSAISLYGMASDLGVRPTENIFNALLSLCDGERVSQGLRVLSEMRNAGFVPAENHYAFLLREAAGRGAYEEAFARLREMTSTGAQPRLRSYAPLLHGLCERPDMALASEIWAHMAEQGVKPMPEEYMAVIGGWASAGELNRRVLDGSVDALFQQLSESGFELSPPTVALSEKTLPRVMNHPQEKSVTESTNGISNGNGNGSGSQGNSNSSAGYLQTILAAFNSYSATSNEGGGSVVYPGNPVAGIASVSSRGTCECCGARLRALGLDAEERARVRSALKKLDAENFTAITERSGRNTHTLIKGPEDGSSENRSAVEKNSGSGETGNLEHFALWLEERRRGGSRFTTVVDGCNVAYYNQNKEGGKFQISQVDLVVRLLENQGERVLVILPERYLNPVVPNSSRSKGIKNAPSTSSPEDLEMIAGWDQRGALYRCVDGTDDDLFWMYFTVSSDAASADVETPNLDVNLSDRDNGRDGVKVDDDDLVRDYGGLSRGSDAADRLADSGGSRDEDRVARRWGAVDGGSGSGSSCDEPRETSSDDGVSMGIDRRLMVVTNDEMRNHRMALLEPVPFRRWRNSQVRGFHFISPRTPGASAAASLPDASSIWDASELAVPQSGSRNYLADERDPSSLQRRGNTLPVVQPPSSFTRDMQVAGRAWHVPIRDQDGGPGKKWLCVNLGAISDTS